MGGEDNYNWGSPPLVRERLTGTGVVNSGARITPARAGKTRLYIVSYAACKDHPRSCGKDKGGTAANPRQQGSPPLVRERLNRPTFFFFHSGITPARAGKTKRGNIVLQHRRDHPRSCGKDSFHGPADIVCRGSPPLVRERHRLSVRSISKSRITPARAGKTLITLSANLEE